MRIEIARFNEYTNPNSPTLRGFCNVSVLFEDYSLEIRDCRYNEKEEEGRKSGWVTLPSRPYEDKQTGETKHAPIVRLDDETYKTFQRAAVKALRVLTGQEEPPQRERVVYTDEDEIPF
mgnify:CR=1 FL=1|tara:strand:- start:292 stop:648 length:357 start_codon:yes stop_codon:yes gene_type:complete